MEEESFARRHGSPSDRAQSAGVWPLLPEPLRVSWALLWDDLENAPPGDPDQQLANMAPRTERKFSPFTASETSEATGRVVINQNDTTRVI